MAQNNIPNQVNELLDDILDILEEEANGIDNQVNGPIVEQMDDPIVEQMDDPIVEQMDGPVVEQMNVQQNNDINDIGFDFGPNPFLPPLPHHITPEMEAQMINDLHELNNIFDDFMVELNAPLDALLPPLENNGPVNHQNDDEMD